MSVARTPRVPRVLIVAACLAAVACAEGPKDPVPDDPPAVPSCPGDQRWSPARSACEPVLPETTCPPGAMAVVGRPDCVEVGWTACPAGFDRSASGWGCDPVLPEVACAGPSAERLGERACRPIGDCEAPFPPAEATIFVDAAFPDESLDSTRFRAIGPALAQAPAGATVAVEAGTYRESLNVAKAVALVGRCPARVVVESDGGAGAGVRLAYRRAVTVRGIAFTGHRGGAVVTGGGDLTLEDCLLQANRDLGALVADAGSRVSLVRSVVRGSLPNGVGKLGRGLDVEAGGALEAVDSVVAGNREVGVFVEGPGSRVSLLRSVIRQTDGEGDGVGRGAVARKGARLELDESALLENRDIGLFASGEGTRVELRRTSVARTRAGEAGRFGRGVEAQSGARVGLSECALAQNRDVAVKATGEGAVLSLDRVTLRDTRSDASGRWGMGILINDGARAEGDGVAVVGNRGAGVALTGAGTSAALRRSLVLDTRPDEGGLYGFGAMAIGESRLSLVESAVESNTFAGLMAGPGSGSIGATRTLVRDTRSVPGPEEWGFGILVWEDGFLQSAGSVVAANAAVGLIFDGGAGVVAATFVLDNPVGVQAQGGSVLRREPPAGAPADGEVFLSADSLLLGNATATGTSAVSLPEPDLSLP